MTTATITVTEAHQRIADHAAQADHHIRHVESIAVGEFARQGDLYLCRIDSAGKDWRPTDNRQLAPGVSNGSRHVVDGDADILTSPEANPVERLPNLNRVRLLGPQIMAKERITITHPEHAHISLPPGVYQTTYQLDFDRQQAVRD